MKVLNLKVRNHWLSAKVVDEENDTSYGVEADRDGEVRDAIQTLSRFPNGLAKKVKRVKDQAIADRLTAAIQAELEAQGY